MGSELELNGVGAVFDEINDIERRWDVRVAYEVGTRVEYAPFIEFGTDPHLITPNEQEALKFTVNGQTVFAKRVNHPGTDPYPFLRPALHEIERELERYARNSNSMESFMQKAALACENYAKQNIVENGNVVTGTLLGSVRAERVR